jgi:hypothetical protein
MALVNVDLTFLVGTVVDERAASHSTRRLPATRSVSDWLGSSTMAARHSVCSAESSSMEHVVSRKLVVTRLAADALEHLSELSHPALKYGGRTLA